MLIGNFLIWKFSDNFSTVLMSFAISQSDNLPISLFWIIFKIFERIIHNQIQAYLDEIKILDEFQSGFQQDHSTNTALSYLTNEIQCGFDKRFNLLLTGDFDRFTKGFWSINPDTFLKSFCVGFSLQ